MKYLICRKNEINRYGSVNSEDEPLKTLFIFLTDGIGLNYFQKWLKNEEEDETGTNACILKKKKDLIEVSLDINIWGVEDPILLTRANFSEVIDQWEKLSREGWQEIVITQDDSGVHLEGKNNQ